MPRQEWTVAAVPGEVRRLRAEVRSFARRNGASQARTDDVALAVTEIATNAVLHAHRGAAAGTGTIQVVARAEAGELEVSITDDGIGLVPRDDSPGAGLGLIICDQLARVRYGEPPGGGTEVALTFAVAA